jgi:hypothetical protein
MLELEKNSQGILCLLDAAALDHRFTVSKLDDTFMPVDADRQGSRSRGLRPGRPYS